MTQNGNVCDQELLELDASEGKHYEQLESESMKWQPLVGKHLLITKMVTLSVTQVLEVRDSRICRLPRTNRELVPSPHAPGQKEI